MKKTCILAFLLLSIDVYFSYSFRPLHRKVFSQRWHKSQLLAQPSSSSPLREATTTTPTTVKTNLLDLNNTFTNFEGAEDIIIEFDQSARDRTWYIPKDISSGNSSEVWSFWQQKRQVEQRLKDAIERGESNLIPYFQDYKHYLSVEKAEILQLNQDFFLAWMYGREHVFRHLWYNSSDVLSLMPGEKHVISGYENVTSYWIHASPSESVPLFRSIQLHYYGDLAIVTSSLELQSRVKQTTTKNNKNKKKKKYTNASLVTSCTNIFIRDRKVGRYFLLAHLASEVPPAGSSRAQVLRGTYRDPTPRNRPARRGVMLDELGDMLRESMARSSKDYDGYGDEDEEELESEDEEDDDDDDDNEEDDEENENSDDEKTIRIRSKSKDGDSDDEEDDSDEEISEFSGKDIKRVSQFRTALRSAINKLGGNGLPSRMIVIGPQQGGVGSMLSGVLEAVNGRNGIKDKLKSSRKNRDEDSDSDEESDDEDDGRLAAVTISALQYLHRNGRITKSEKQLLTADVIQNVNDGSCSKVEIAMTLFMGGFKPGEGSADQLPTDFSLIAEEDLNDFEAICHRVAHELEE